MFDIKLELKMINRLLNDIEDGETNKIGEEDTQELKAIKKRIGNIIYGKIER
jgi:hypothetical protein